MITVGQRIIQLVLGQRMMTLLTRVPVQLLHQLQLQVKVIQPILKKQDKNQLIVLVQLSILIIVLIIHLIILVVIHIQLCYMLLVQKMPIDMLKPDKHQLTDQNIMWLLNQVELVRLIVEP